MESWSCYKIEDLFEVKNGAAIQSKDFTLNKIDDSYMEVLKIGHIAIGGGLRKEPKKNYVHKTSKLDKFILQKGDIVMAMTDMKDNVTILGVSAMVEEDNKYILNQRVACLRKKTTIEFDDKFVYYQMRTRRFLLPLQKQANRGVQVNLTTDHIRNSIVFLPSLAEQKKISSLFTDIESKIDNNYKICKVLESQAQSLFKHWFVDFTPFKDGKFVESELGLIPEGWRVGKAEDFYTINIGKTPPRAERQWFSETKGNNKIWISISDMGSCGAYISDSKEYLTPEAQREFNVVMVPVGTILLSFKLTIGRVAIADNELTTNEAIARFILPNRDYREFTYLYLKQYKYGSLGSTSSIATAVNSKIIKSMPFLMPSSEVMAEFSTVVSKLFDEIRILNNESLRLATLRDTLLPKLMSGQIKVNEIERAYE